MKKNIKQKFKTLWNIFHNIRESYYCLLGRFCPQKLIKTWYKTVFHKEIDLEHPSNICEKINWMKLHSDLSLWTRCADKYAVRQFVEERGLGATLNDIYGVYKNAKEIDFKKLPNRFVLKTNNGGGGKNVILVNSKNDLNIAKTICDLNRWLKQNGGYRYYEPHYAGITPLIIVEKYLDPNEGEASLIDYKFYCFDGKVHSVFLCSDRRFNQSVCYSTYDLEWNYLEEDIIPKYRTKTIYPKPQSLVKMIEYSSILSKGIPFVRVDWYEINGKPVFSEMTFTPAGGFMKFHSMSYLEELGEQLVLPQEIKK